jgi:hypothetical protein
MKGKIISFLVVMLFIAMISLPALSNSIKFEKNTLNLADVRLGNCITTDYVNGWQDHGLRIKEWPIDGVVYAYVEVYAEDLPSLINVEITHRWWYDNGTGLENKWDWNWVVPEPWGSCWSYTYWSIGLDYGKGWGYIEVLADGVSIGTSNNYAMDNTQPNKPTISGKSSGAADVEYEYTFNAVDPDGFDICYYVDWGDETNSGWTEYFASGTDVKLKHTWAEQGDYVITCKGKDLVDSESEEATLSISMPKNKVVNFNFLEYIFEQFSNLFPRLRDILKI